MIGESSLKKFCLSYSVKCPSEKILKMSPSKHDVMCPSKHDQAIHNVGSTLPTNVLFKLNRTKHSSALLLCVIPFNVNKMLAPKPTYTQRANTLGAIGAHVYEFFKLFNFNKSSNLSLPVSTAVATSSLSGIEVPSFLFETSGMYLLSITLS